MAVITEKYVSRLNLISALSIVALLVISMGYISVSRYYKDFEIRTEIFKEDYFTLTKEKIKASVEIQIYQVESKNVRVVQQIKEDLIKNVDNMHRQLEKSYRSGGNIKTSLFHRKSFVDTNGYCNFHLILNDKGTIIYSDLENGLQKGKNYFRLKNDKGEPFIKNIINIANKNESGFYQYSWKKHNGTKDIYPQLVYVKKFKRLNWIIVDGVYLDEVEKEIKDKMLERMNSIAGLFENDTYLSVYEISKNQKDKTYLKILVHYDQSLIDKKVFLDDLNKQDLSFFENMLDTLEKKGEIFASHRDVRPQGTEKKEKISYFHFYPRWNWIFARGFYLEDLENIISKQKTKFEKDIQKDVKSFLLLLLVFMAISVLVSVMFSRNIHRIIINYKQKVTRQNKELIKLNQILDETGRKDPLTNLSNRRDMNEKLMHYQALFQRNKRPFALVMADIDYFKSINDAYGHDMGDFILVWLSEFLKDSLRAQDIVSRWGGEEFLILLPETNLEGASVLAEKIREKISNSPIFRKGIRLNVTLTFGVSVYDKNVDIEKIIKLADDALYWGKKNGRNQVVVKE